MKRTACYNVQCILHILYTHSHLPPPHTHTHSHLPPPPTPHTHTQKPAFVARTASDELSELLQACNEETTLDLFSAEGSMNVTAAMVRGVSGGGVSIQ